jgi:hypothetical protein
MKKQTSITHEEVMQALAQFRKAGGLIRKLPDAPTVRNLAVTVHGPGSNAPGSLKVVEI